MAKGRKRTRSRNPKVGNKGSMRTNAQRKEGGVIDPSGSAKRQLYNDYGWPRYIRHYQIMDMFRRSGLAEAAVEQTLFSCWQEIPVLRRGEDDMEPQEELLNESLERINFWGMFREAHRRSLVTGYSALVLRVADDQMDLRQPLAYVGDGPESLVEAVPVWSNDVIVATRGLDRNEPEDYGRPLIYSIHNRDNAGRIIDTLEVHKSRVLIVSRDGTMDCVSELEKAFNAAADSEKVRGAAAEGAWKNARMAMVLNLAADAELQAIGGTELNEPEPANSDAKEAAANLDQQIENFYSKADNAILTQGVDTTVVGQPIGDLGSANDIAVQHLCAAFKMPLTILRGIESGEKSSTENAKLWARACESRRTFSLKPIIRSFIGRLIDMGAIDGSTEWRIEWTPLTEATQEERIAAVKAMVAANQGFWNQGGRVCFTENEIRRRLGEDELTDEQINDALDRMNPELLDSFGADDSAESLDSRTGGGASGESGARNE